MRIFEFRDLGYQTHDSLNPRLWDSDLRLRPEVKLRLLKIAELFREFIDIEDLPVADLVITGGQATRHYTDHSDLDLHLIIDYDRVRCDGEVEELLDTKRLLFKQQHDIRLRGIPVEPGTEDRSNPGHGASWSLVTDSWLRQVPEPTQEPDEEAIDQAANQWSKLIDQVLGQNQPETIEKLQKILRKYRKTGLKTSGEYGMENLVYKTLRNRGYLEKLKNHIQSQQDRALSLREAPSG